MLITRTEIILAIHRHTSSVPVWHHFLSMYTCGDIVSFPNHQLLGMRLTPTFELRHYDAKVKLLGASIKIWEQATVAKAIHRKKGLILSD